MLKTEVLLFLFKYNWPVYDYKSTIFAQNMIKLILKV